MNTTKSYDQISFLTETKIDVDNDEIYARMYKKSKHKEINMVANKLNTAINYAIKIAENYPNVQLTTDKHSTYPESNDKGKLISWIGQTDIKIRSTHLDEASELIAKLQDIFILADLEFGVSEARQNKIKIELIKKVSENFQQQAELISNSFKAKGYRLVCMDLNTNNNSIRPRRLSSNKPLICYSSSNSEVETANFEASHGNSQMSITANGTIELIR